ncbi:MAG: caspase family protein [Stigonema ocellatum SAG 48.90 = DSM 106950]|nr:caspase family protein [Stigonema ocellatum SAG 48.90 = DSM 106950]
MANNWAIAIGINQYHFLQPLSCAQADAEALKDFLVTEGGFLPEKCMLLTDTSPPLGDRSTYPTKENILLLVEDLAAACWQPQDTLWFFFSGYGINYNGQDYLMPIEGSPDGVEKTGIELRGLMQSLQIAALNALVLLDINRAFGTQAYTLVGQETIELAQELKVPTILSCQPEQFSHESSELGHGFFTAALLEALRSRNGSTLADLGRYLSIRTPELCQHHWRPTQNPVTVIISTQQVTLSQLEAKSNLENIPILNLEQMLPPAVAAPPLESVENSRVGEAGGVQEDTGTSSLFASLSSPPTPQRSGDSPPPKFQNKGTADAPFWQMFVLWGATTMLLLCLILIVLLRDKAGLRVEEIPALPQTASSDTKVVKPLPKLRSAPLTAPVEQHRQSISQPQASSSQPQQKQALLDLTKMSLSTTQVRDLAKAIATAHKIKPSEPLYQQAQENIQIWSSMILDLAEVRATQRQYANAITAAQLIGKDEPLYLKAQSAINRWRLEAKKYMSNKTLLEAANALIQPEQASSYNRAIVVAKKVPSNEPGFDDAQKSINQWSQKILDMATRRADQGELNAAIETALLVPEGTEAYNRAQEAVQKWQKK